MKAIPESVSSGDDDDDGSSDEGGEQLPQLPRRRQSRGAKRLSKHGPRALSRREILEGAEDPDNEGLQWLKKRGELSSKVQARLEALVPVEKSLDRLWKKSETSTIVTCQSRRRS